MKLEGLKEKRNVREIHAKSTFLSYINPTNVLLMHFLPDCVNYFSDMGEEGLDFRSIFFFSFSGQKMQIGSLEDG